MNQSPNHIYRLVWSEGLGAFVPVPVPECGRGRGKGGRRAALCKGAMAVTLAGASMAWAGGPLPTGGQVAQGTASIEQSGSVMTVQQTTPRLVTNWQSFDIAAGSTVQFVQPSAAAVALNRVVGGDASVLQGALKANGQVFLVNPNGILFSSTARVDVGGLVASTQGISDADFMAGRYRFEGSSSASVINEGQLRAAEGGTVALIAAKIVNTGTLDAPRGQAVLASAGTVTLDVGGPAQLQVERGVLDGLVENGGAIRADGGRVFLTARALDHLSRSVVNNTGLVRARTLATGERGEIVLLGDMAHGTLNVAGTLDASAPSGGDGGFIETSAATVNTAALQVDAGSRHGSGGQWLIDPYDYTIGSSAATNIATALNTGTNVTVTTQSNTSGYGATASGSGDITVASAITKTAGGNATLTLRADRNIVVNSAITSTVGQLGITLSAANNAASALGGVAVNANLASNGGKIMIGGAGGSTTAAQANGIGYALNSSSSAPAIKIGTNASITSGGGDIVLNGYTTATTASYDATKGGVYVLSGATLDSGGGNIYLSATSAGDAKEFAFGVEGNSGTVTTFRTGSSSGAIVVDVNNTANVLGSLGLVNNGNQARIQFWAPSVAHMLFRLNGNNQAAQFTQSPPCNPGYPNCGTMVIPGGNSSYTSAGYNVVSTAMNPIYVFTGSGSRTYDGTTSTTGLATPTTLGGPNGFTVANLGTLSFSTASKNAGAYTTLVSSASNPSTYSGGIYAVAYFNQGTYTISPKTLNSFSASNKVYDGTNTAAVTSSGLVAGDAVTLNATGSFTQSGVGNGLSVNITGVSLAGTDAGNYSISGFSSINTTANITPAALTVTANAGSKIYDGSAYSGGNGVSYSGFVNNETTSVLGGSLGYAGTAQGAVNAGSYGITPQGLTSSNYSVSFVPGTLTISPATLTLTANAASRTYGAVNPALTGAVSGFVGNDTLGNATSGTLAFGTAATASNNVGSYAVTGSGLTANNGNYVFAQASSNASALSVTPAALTVTANAGSKTYDGLAYSGGNGVSYSGFVNNETSSVLGGSLSYTGSSQGAVNAGSYGITPQGLTSSNYTVSFAPGTLTVNPAALTVTANAGTKTYDGLAYSGGNGVSYSGFVNNETSSVLGGSLSYAGTSQGAVNAGSYGITPQGLTSSNYTVSFASGALTVNPAALTVTANAASKTYDGLAYSGGNGVSYSGFVNNETASVLGGSLSYTGTSQGAINAGSYGITPQGLTSSNYTVSFAPGTLTVNPAALTVTANAGNKTYDGLAYSGGNGVSYSGFVHSETASVLGGSLSYAGTSQGAVNAGTYGITPQGLTSSNYTVSFAPGALTVNPAALTVTANAGSKTYDGLAYSGGNGVSYSGFVNNETASVLGGSLSYTGTSQSAINAGTYGITPQGLTSSNYTVSFAPGTLTVNPAALTVTANAGTKTYDGLAYSGGNGVSYSGFVNNETASVLGGSLSYTGTSQSAINAGSYGITPQGLTSSNYTVSFAPGTLTVNPAALTVTANAGTKTYDGLAYSGGNGVSYSGFVHSETASVLGGSLSYAGTSQGAVNAGSYGITPQGLTSSNYTVSFAPGTLTVNPAALTVTANAGSKTYDGLAYSGGNGASYSGFVNNETASVLGGSLSYTGTSQGAINAGSYGITPQGLTSSNYTVSFAPGTLTVNPAALTVTANAGSKTYDGLAYIGGNGVSYSGFVNNETASVLGGSLSYAGTSQGAINAGSYGITPQGLTSSNYTVSFAPGTLTVNPAALTVTANAGSKTYDGLAYSGGNGVSYSGFVNNETSSVLGGSLSYTGTSQGAINAGSYGITPQGLTSTNYTVSFAPGALTVNPAALTVTANAGSKTYDGLAYSGGNGASYSGFVNNETSSVLGGSLSYTGTSQGAVNAGSYGITPQGLTSSNYTVSFAPGTLTVNPAALTVTANAGSKTYDGLAYSGGNGVSYSGFVNNETSSVLGGSLSYAGTSQGAVNAGTYGITPQGLTSGNYAITFVPGVLSITPAGLTVVTGSLTGVASKTYDGTATATLSPGNFLLTGFVGSDGAQVTKTTGTYADANAGTAKQVTVSLASGDFAATGNTNLANYALPNSVSGAIGVITPAPLSVIAAAASKTYDGAAYGGGNGISYSGFVHNETAGVLGGSLSYTGTSQGAVNAGTYAIAPQGLTSGNYAISFVPGALTVNPATLTVSADATSRTYGASNPTLTGSVAGFVGNDTLGSATSGTLSFSTAATAGSNVGSYAVTGSGLTANHGNYVIEQASANATALSVTRAPLTVTAGVASKTYDGLAYSGGNGVSYSGFVNNETTSVLGGSLGYAGTAQGAVNAGSYGITPQGLTSSNYSVSFVPGTLTISPATLTLTANAASRTYGAVNPALTGAVSGFVGNDTLGSATSGTLAFGTAATASSNVGSYAVTGSGLTANNGNYVFAQASSNASALSVTPAALTVTANAGSKTYDGLAYSGGNGVSYSGFVNNETSSVLGGSLSYTGSSQGAINAGSYGITPQGLTGSNYTVSFAPGTLTVNPAALTVTANAGTKTYDGLAYSGGNGVSYSGFVNNETSSVLGGSLSYAGTSQGAVNAGSYGITPQGLSSSNYAVSFASGTLTITPATLQVITGALTGVTTKVYDGTTTATLSPANFLLTGFVGQDGAAVTKTTGSYADRNVGSGKWVTVSLAAGDFQPAAGTQLANYVLPVSASGTIGTITPAALTLGASAASKTYDGTLAASGTVGVTGLVAGDLITGLGQAFTDKHAGTGKTVLVTPGWTVQDGFGGANYVVTTVANAGGSISPRAASAAVQAGMVTYNGSVQSQAAATTSGFLAGDDVQVSGRASGRNAGVYGSALAVTGADAANYDVTLTNAALTIARAPLTITAAPDSKTYDGTSVSSARPTVTGLLGTDTVNGLQQAYADPNAGSGKTVAVTGYTLGDGNGGGNYIVTTTGSTAAAVTPATLTISAASLQQTQGKVPVPTGGTVTGFVNGETLATATTGTLVFQTTASAASAPGSYSVQGSGLSALHGNYVFVQAPQNAQALTLTPAPTANVETLVKPPAPVPNFPDNARPALGVQASQPTGAGLNYVALTQPLASSGTTLGTSAPALPVTPVSIDGGAALAPPVVSGATSAGLLIPAMPLAGSGQAAANDPSSTGGNGAAPAAQPNPPRTAQTGTAALAVRSANGPLDVFVVDGGINLGRETVATPAR